MTDALWDYPETAGRTDATGYNVEAFDGSAGHVEDVALEQGVSYLVVDTGPSVFGRKVLIPAGAVDRIDREAEKVFLSLPREALDDAPQYDAKRPFDDEQRDELSRYYAGRVERSRARRG